MFITMPKVFDSLQLGGFIGLVFFLLVLFAALTSAISLMECSVATYGINYIFQERKRLLS